VKGVNPNPDSSRPVEARERLRILTDRVEHAYYSGFCEPGGGVLAGGAATGITGDTCYVEYPAGAVGVWRRNVYLPEDWQAAGLYTKIWYSSPAAGGGNYTFVLGGNSPDAGDVITALPALYSRTLALAAPGAINGSLVFEDTLTTSTFPRARRAVSMRWVRRGDLDLNPNALRVLLIYFRAWRIA
jgi:hypothetical protein